MILRAQDRLTIKVDQYEIILNVTGSPADPGSPVSPVGPGKPYVQN